MEEEYEVGDRVRIKSGVFASFPGRVEAVAAGSLLLTVAVEILGQDARLELFFNEVEKIGPPDAPGGSANN